MTTPLVILAILSITIGYLTKDLFIGFGTDFWGSAIYISSVNYTMADIEFLPLLYKLLPLFLTLAGVYSAYIIYTYYTRSWMLLRSTNSYFNSIYTFFNKKWFFDRIYNQFLVLPVVVDSYYFAYQNIDRGIIEKTGPGMISDTMFNAVIKDIQDDTLLNQVSNALLMFFVLLLSIYFGHGVLASFIAGGFFVAGYNTVRYCQESLC